MLNCNASAPPQQESLPLAGPGFGLASEAPEIILRPYQLETLARLASVLAGGVRRVILQTPCGGGKTIMAAELIRRAVSESKQVLFLAHRRELVNQCSEKLSRFGIDHGVIMAGVKPSLMPCVQVASVQTLIARLGRGRIQAPPADLMIFDECHHNVSKTHHKLIIETYPDAILIGLSATPCRSDGRGLGI